MSSNQPQFCAICAWRETCAKKFCVPDGGARCADFTRDVSIRATEKSSSDSGAEKQSPEER